MKSVISFCNLLNSCFPECHHLGKKVGLVVESTILISFDAHASCNVRVLG